MGDDLEKNWDEFVQGVKTQRDELKLQMHLMKADMKDEWDELEHKWHKVEPRLEESADDIGAATRKLAHEIADAYRRIKDAI